MLFKAFLQLSCQLVDTPFGKVSIDEREIEFHTSEKVWLLSSKIYSNQSIPASMTGLLTQTSLNKWGVKGAQFRYNKKDNSISLVQKSPPLSNFVNFKSSIDLFIKLVEEWERAVLALDPTFA
ncbi:MAG: hypothetical protein P0S95_08455 [Rhabdochlamydiaceae bacterium]|nr:hypothetical protein [Candidatus Amphrikana amoebophyrae]